MPNAVKANGFAHGTNGTSVHSAKPKASTISRFSKTDMRVQRATANWASEGSDEVCWKQEVITCSPAAWSKLVDKQPELKKWCVLPTMNGIIAISPRKYVG